MFLFKDDNIDSLTTKPLQACCLFHFMKAELGGGNLDLKVVFHLSFSEISSLPWGLSLSINHATLSYGSRREKWACNWDQDCG
jgi:hypothetical protein